MISTLLSFRRKITWQVQPTQPMTRANEFNPNIRLDMGQISIHLIQSGWVWVSPKPDLTWLVDNPTGDIC